ncbi:MAG: DUF4982 domain-containing protein [Prevotellaceae bacterium]|nr:DUF4982 domain-containing protein [Candidatus Minthosoma caballi]
MRKYQLNTLKALALGVLAVMMPNRAIAQYIEEVKGNVAENVAIGQFAAQQRVLFNFDWKFAEGEVSGAEKAEYDDSAWRKLDLPHDFQFEQPWDEKEDKGRGFKKMCGGWYRKTFKADESWKGKKVVMDFGGVMYYCDVYVNGKKVGSNEYGYTGFEVDMSKVLNYDGDNVVAVYANTGKMNGSRWYTGGGIFRDVYVKAMNPTHIARHGLYIQTISPSSSLNGKGYMSANSSEGSLGNQSLDGVWTALVQVQVEGWQKHDVKIKAIVKDADGKVIGSAESAMPDHTIQNNTEVMLPEIKVSNPKLWDIDSPTLYSVEAVLVENGVTIDSVADNFGFRKIEYGTDFGFKLNGKKVFLTGIANHHDMGALGVAAFDDGVERMMRQLKAFGFNAIRCSHNPYSEGFYKMADKVGLLIVDELIDKWSDKDYWGGRKPFMQIWPELMSEWVKKDRNHPCIVMWSLGNELQTRSDWSGYQTNDWGITTYKIFDTFLKRYDRTRPTTVAMFPARAGAQRNTPDFKTYLVPPELACETEVASFNYQWDAYHGYYDHKKDLILFQSEAVTNQLLQPFFGMNQERGVGLCWWGAIEYWGESNGWPKKGWNYSFFNHTMQPYPQAWLIKSAIKAEEPVVKIGVISGKGESMEWNDIKVGQQKISTCWNFAEGSKQNLFTYTNADEVELLVNGKSIGVKKNERDDIAKKNMILWSGIEYGNGGTVTAIARKEGKEVSRDEIASSGKAVKLVVQEEKLLGEWQADGMSLRYLNIYAVDAKGKVVENAEDEVTVEVEGEATLVAIDNGDHYTNDIFHKVKTKKMQSGYMQCILRSTRKSGNVTLKVSSPTLKASKIAIKTK